MIYVDMERLGPVLTDAVLPIPPAIFVINDEAGAGIHGCSAPNTASEIDVLSERYWGRY